MQTERCGFIKGSGERCKGSATGPHGLCWHHSPENAERRSRMASRAAKAKPNKEVVVLKGELKALKDDVLEGRVDRNDAAVVVRIYSVLKDFIELERRVKETDELAAEIAELREGLGHEQTA